MRVAAAASTRRSGSSDSVAIVLDVFGRRVALNRADARRLQAAASEEAGRSSVARDLSLLLGEALTGRTLALRRVEATTLERLARDLGLAGAAAQLADG